MPLDLTDLELATRSHGLPRYGVAGRRAGKENGESQLAHAD
jgi:hypothetical protein